jgi:hypothetical protein
VDLHFTGDENRDAYRFAVTVGPEGRIAVEGL